MEYVYDENVDYSEFHLTGYFRDGVRRVDLVIVSKDHSDEQLETLKMNFLINVIESGMQIEVEAGVKTKHRHLLFIKIHAPDHVIKHYGTLFDFRKYFKSQHAEHIQSWVKGERDLVKLVRLSSPGPLNYSTTERSLITFKALQAVSFGEPKNYVGLQKLLDKGLFLDVYPLHDGPHFFVPGQHVKHLNGRQALFYKWVGYSNIFGFQPIHLIREYFGERIGFLFTFYQYVNVFTLIMALPGIWAFYKGYDTSDRGWFRGELLARAVGEGYKKAEAVKAKAQKQPVLLIK